MDETSARLKLPLLVAGQGQKEITHNEALIMLEWFAAPTVLSRTELSPVNISDGNAWLVPEGASGEWQGHDGRVALRWSNGWRYLNPPDGLSVYVIDERSRVFRADNAWNEEVVLSAPHAGVQMPVGGTVVDQQARNTLNELIEALENLGIFQSS